MDKSQINNLLARYQRGEATPKEKAMIEAYMLMAEKEHAHFTEREKEVIKARIWNNLYTAKAPGRKTQWISSMSQRSRKIAAVGILLCGLGITAYIFQYQLRDLVDPVAIKTIETGPYEIKQVPMPDGSVVTLAQNSSISFPESYRSDKRRALVHGTAFFNIAHDAARPFNVESDELNINVLGTSFQVEDAKSGYEASVTVVTGKVQVNRENRQLAILHSNQQITYDKFSRQSTIVQQMNAAAETGWTNNQLVFNETPLAVVIKTLQVYYEIKIELPESALRTGGTFSGAFGRNESRKEVLDVICLSSGLSYSVTRDSTIIIRD